MKEQAVLKKKRLRHYKWYGFSVPFLHMGVQVDLKDPLRFALHDIWTLELSFCPWMGDSITRGDDIGVSLIVADAYLGLNITLFKPYIHIGIRKTI